MNKYQGLYQRKINPGPAGPLDTLSLQTVQIQMLASKKPTDLDLHNLPVCEFVSAT